MIKTLFRGKTLQRITVVVAALAMAAGVVAVVRAQAQTCRDVNNMTICGDVIEEGSVGFSLKGNVRMGVKSGPMLVKIDDMATTFNFLNINESTYKASYFHLNAPDPNTGTTDFAIGKARWINDPNTSPLLSTHYVLDPANSNQVVAGRLFVDTTNKKISFPPAGAVPIFVSKGVERAGPYLMDFFARSSILTFFNQGGTVGEFNTIDAEFDLTAKQFKATFPISLKLVGGSRTDNEALQVTGRVTYGETGAFAGSIDGFKLKIAGLVLDAKGIVLKPTEFEAATVDVSKADNPDVPPLDPTKPDVVFSFSKLLYKNNQWSIGGVTVPVNPWEFGDAFRMKNQTLGLINDAVAQTLSFQFNSTLEFGAAASGTPVPITLKIGRTTVNGVAKPNIEAGLQNMSPSIGPMKLNLQGVTFAGSVAEDFYGIKATSFSLQWPGNLGGQTAAGLSNFRLGIDKAKKLKFSLGAVSFGAPTMENTLLRMTLTGTAGVVGDSPTITMTGNMTVKLTGNNAVGATGQLVVRSGKSVCTAPNNTSPTGTTTTCLKRMEGSLAGFNLKLAGFSVALTNAKLFEDGGFGAQTASLTLPTGVTSGQAANGISISGFAVNGAGNVQVAGGGFELAPLSIGNFQFVGLKGSFAKDTDGSYVFAAGGKMPLPGIEPGANSPGISVALTIRVNPTTNQTGGGVLVSFTAPFGTGIPIGNTGMEMTGISGGFDVKAGTVQITAGMVANTLLRVPAPINLPIAKITGATTLQVNPFKLTANAQLSILLFNVANANMAIGNNAAFNGTAPGFHLDVNITGVVVQGGLKLDVGRVTANGVTKTKVAATAFAQIGVKKHTFAGLPLVDRVAANVTLSGGHFKDNRNGENGKERFGLKGTITVVGLSASGFIDFSDGAPDIIAIGLDKIVPINTAAVRANAAAGMPGYASRILRSDEAVSLGLISGAAASLEGAKQGNGIESPTIMQDVVPIQITQTTTLVAGVFFPSGSPVVRLRLPNSTILTQATVNGTTQTYGEETGDGQTYRGYQIVDAAPGAYELIIDNAPASYTAQSFTVNQAPQISVTNLTCTGSTVPGVTVLCDGATHPADITISWNATDTDSTADVRVGYAAITDTNAPIDYTSIKTLADDLPLGAGSFTWNLGEVPTGKYKLVVIAEDNSNAPVWKSSSVVMDVTDQRAPAVPAGLTTTPLAGELSVRWTQNTERDLAGYEIGLGIVNDGNPDTPANFVYTRNMGPKQVVTGTNDLVDAKLWGLADDVEVYYSIRSYDESGNYSDWSANVIAKPWALSPEAWTPTPNSTGVSVASIDVAFGSAMNSSSLSGSTLILRDASGNAVPGTVTPVFALDGATVIGASFKPSGSLAGNALFTAVVKGGGAGVLAADGRQMGGDYSWSFSTGLNTMYLPLTRR